MGNERTGLGIYLVITEWGLPNGESVFAYEAWTEQPDAEKIQYKHMTQDALGVEIKYVALYGGRPKL